MDAIIKKNEWCNVGFYDKDGSVKIIFGLSETNLHAAISEYIERNALPKELEGLRELDQEDKIKMTRSFPVKIKWTSPKK